MQRMKFRIHLTKQLLNVSRCGELQFVRRAGFVGSRSHRDKFQIPAVIDQIERHSSEPNAAIVSRLFHHALKGFHSAIVHELGHFFDLSAAQGGQACSDPTGKTD
jgi:hypothetical protein